MRQPGYSVSRLLLFAAFYCLLLLSDRAFAQQDPISSQYIFNGLSLNPAFAGYKEAVSIALDYRNQWTGLDGAPKSFFASADAPLNRANMGLGIEFSHDQAGLQQTQRLYLSYAYRLQLTEDSRLSFGLGIGGAQYSLDGTRYDPIQPNDPILIPSLNIITRPDMKAGLLFANSHYFAGLSFTDLLSNFRTNDAAYLLIKRRIHSYFSAGAIFNLNRNLKIKPSLLIREDFKSPGAADLNCFVIFNNRLWTGVSYREGLRLGRASALQTDLSANQAWVFMVQLYLADNLRLGYSFDYAATRLQQVSSGTHEISLGYTFRRKNASMLTPRFF